MADSNEIVDNSNHKNARLRPPQAGLAAQKEYDEGKPLTSRTYADRMNQLMLDMMNGRVERHDGLAIVQVGNSILKAAELELKNREMYFKYHYKYEQNMEGPDPLQLASRKALLGKE